MNKFLTLATAATLALAPTAAHATDYQARNNLDRALTRHGNVRIGNCTANGDNPGSRAMGLYRTAGRTVYICTELTGRNTPEFWSTVRHEAVHMAQHCLGGLTSDTPIMDKSWLISNASSSDKHFVSNNYPSNHYWVEVEAFTLQKFNNQAIANLVNKACG